MSNASGYAEFLASKAPKVTQVGPAATASDVSPFLHDWQRELTAWAAVTGRAALWEDTGLGKTVQQVEWARLVGGGGVSLILAPLAVTAQTVREAGKLDVEVRYVRDGVNLSPGIYVTNYEMAQHFPPEQLAAVVLDEASILKASDGKMRTRLIEQFAEVPYRLACTATPAPNDPEELTNQAAFLGRSTRADMLAAYFVHDSDGWRLKGHARAAMMTWMATWAVALRKPSDMGYSDEGYDLPGLRILPSLVPANIDTPGQLFTADIGGVSDRAKVRRETLVARCERAAKIVAAEPDEPWLIWCGLNAEAALLADLLGATNVHGSMSPQDKADSLLGFADGKVMRLVTKPSLASFGMNWQHCARMIFVGLSDSYEAYYQAIRRCYRYGQTRVVDAHIVLSDLESVIAANVARKEREAARMTGELVIAMQAARATMGSQS